jgi:hypothetical protein
MRTSDGPAGAFFHRWKCAACHYKSTVVAPKNDRATTGFACTRGSHDSKKRPRVSAKGTQTARRPLVAGVGGAGVRAGASVTRRVFFRRLSGVSSVDMRPDWIQSITSLTTSRRQR